MIAAPSMAEIIATLADGQRLQTALAKVAVQYIMSGQASPIQTAAFLTALRVRGESIDELEGAVQAVRERARTITAPAGTIDTCGTGGSGTGCYNISTATGLIVAACGVPVAKHGNRGVSSLCGSAEVLAALGVNIDCDPQVAQQCLWEVGFCFLMAPHYHPSMSRVAPVRRELAIRTIFNLVGPLANPARPSYQLLGVWSPQWLEPVARVLERLGCQRAWVVHGLDGLDELTTTGTSRVARLQDGVLKLTEVTPEQAGLPRTELKNIKGGDAEVNAQALRRLLEGRRDAYRDIVLFNSAAALMIAGLVNDLLTGVAIASEVIDNGKAASVLERVKALTNATGSTSP